MNVALIYSLVDYMIKNNGAVSRRGSGSLLHPLVALLNVGELDTLILGKRDESLLALTDNEKVANAGGEGVAVGVAHVGDVERTGVLLDMREVADATDVVAAGDVDKRVLLEFNNLVDLSGLEVVLRLINKGKWRPYLDRVTFLDVGVRVAESAPVVSNDIRNLVLANGTADDLANLERGVAGVDFLSLEAALDIDQHAEVLASLLDGHDVLEAQGELVVATDLVVNLDESFLVLNDLHGLLVGHGELQPLAEEDAHGDALTQLVGALAGAGGVDAGQLLQHPVFGRKHALKVLLRSTGLHGQPDRHLPYSTKILIININLPSIIN